MEPRLENAVCTPHVNMFAFPPATCCATTTPPSAPIEGSGEEWQFTHFAEEALESVARLWMQHTGGRATERQKDRLLDGVMDMIATRPASLVGNSGGPPKAA